MECKTGVLCYCLPNPYAGSRIGLTVAQDEQAVVYQHFLISTVAERSTDLCAESVVLNAVLDDNDLTVLDGLDGLSISFNVVNS